MLAKIKAWCRNSETIGIARLKMGLGLLFTAVTQSGIDISQFVDSPKLQLALKVFFAYLVLDGTLTEWARRRNAPELK